MRALWLALVIPLGFALVCLCVAVTLRDLWRR